MDQLPTIVVDNREQLPWTFAPDVAHTIHGTLPAADYSLVGLEEVVAIERKELNDLVNTVIHGWSRFKKELFRLGGYEMACVAVEANVEDVLNHRYTSDAHPHSVLGRCHAILADYGVPVFFWGPRPVARHVAERFLLLAAKRFGNDGA